MYASTLQVITHSKIIMYVYSFTMMDISAPHHAPIRCEYDVISQFSIPTKVYPKALLLELLR